MPTTPFRSGEYLTGSCYSKDAPSEDDRELRPLARVLARRMLRTLHCAPASDVVLLDQRRQVEQLSDDLLQRLLQLPQYETVCLERGVPTAAG